MPFVEHSSIPVACSNRTGDTSWRLVALATLGDWRRRRDCPSRVRVLFLPGLIPSDPQSWLAFWRPRESQWTSEVRYRRKLRTRSLVAVRKDRPSHPPGNPQAALVDHRSSVPCHQSRSIDPPEILRCPPSWLESHGTRGCSISQRGVIARGRYWKGKPHRRESYNEGGRRGDSQLRRLSARQSLVSYGVHWGVYLNPGRWGAYQSSPSKRPPQTFLPSHDPEGGPQQRMRHGGG